MACVSPLRGYRLPGGEISFKPSEKALCSLTIPCGQCLDCKLERSRQWAVRCMHESQMHDANCFITLTYDSDHIPSDWSLYYRHFQLFMKRLRKRFGIPVRFYMCGEYGSENHRPHYHAILFGVHFGDKYYWRKSPSGCDLFRSPILEELWGMGSCEIGEVTFESAAYVARYCIKSIAGAEWICDSDTGEMYERPREFTRMSLKPGIGVPWFNKYRSEVYPLDRVVVRGKEVKPPRAYDRLLRVVDEVAADALDLKRNSEDIKRKRVLSGDITPARLAVRAEISRARIKSKYRSL